MKPFGKVLPTLLSVLILTACGGEETTSSTASNAPVDDGITDPAPDNSGDNSAPVISGTPNGSVDEGAAYRFAPVVYDADGDTLSFTIENQPYWASFDTDTGVLSGTPDSNAAATYSDLIIRVSDGQLEAALPSFEIVVNDVGGGTSPTDPPEEPETAPTLQSAVISGSDIVLSWTQSGLTPDGGYDIFVDGVDTNTEYRTTSLTASITGLDLSVSHCFNVQSRYTSSSSFYTSNQVCSVAQDLNQAPTISGSPAANVVAGVEYAFTPTAEDPDNDTLSFSVTNLPSWASFDDQTGAISGTPAESDVGVYGDIVVSVSDGEETVSMSPFAVEVETSVAATGSLSLKWVAPVTRDDGSSLDVSEIDGYQIYIGESSDSLQLEVDLSDGAATSYTVEDLPVGTYYVALTAYDGEGLQSGYSNIITVSVN